MHELAKRLQQAPHHLMVRIDTIHYPTETNPQPHQNTVRVEAFVADAPRSRETEGQGAFSVGDTITFTITPCLPDPGADQCPHDQATVFYSILQPGRLYEVVLDQPLSVVEGWVVPLDDQPEAPRYNEFGAFHG